MAEPPNHISLDSHYLVLGVLALSSVTSITSTYSLTAIVIAFFLYLLKDHFILRQELLSEKKYHWVVVIIAVSLLTDLNLDRDATLVQLVGGGQNWALIALLFFLYHHSTLKDATFPAAYSTLSIIAVALFLLGGGRSVLPEGLSNPSHVQSLLLALGTYYSSPATEPGYIPGITELVVIPALWLITSSLRATDPLSEPYVHWILLGALALTGVIFTLVNVAGPLRYGCHNYQVLYRNFRLKIPTWSHFPLLWLAFHPWTGWWLLGGFACITWQYVREHHREAAAKISDEVEKATSRASSLAIWAKDKATAAKLYNYPVNNLIIAKQDTIKIATSVRDSADSIHKLAIDIVMLATIGDIEAAQQSLIELQGILKECEEQYIETIKARENAQQLQKQYEDAMTKISKEVEKVNLRASSLVAWAKDEAATAERYEIQAYILATGVTRDARSAHYIGIADFYTGAAMDKAPLGIMNHENAASEASTTAVNVTVDAANAAKAARAARDAADSARELAIDAKALATVGDVEAAQVVVSKMREALKQCEEKHDDAVRARESAQQKMAGSHGEVVAFSVAEALRKYNPDSEQEEGEEDEESDFE